MRLIVCLLISCLGTVAIVSAQDKPKRFDSTMKLGKSGYRVICRNTKPDRNNITVSPIGFEKDVRDFNFEIPGRLRKAEVDDLNRDGFPDLVLYVFPEDSLERGNVIGIASEKNETVAPISFPDIYNEPKFREGYRGHDSFALMEGFLVRRFPVYDAVHPDQEPVNTRQITYRVVPGETGGYQFKAVRSYDFARK
ncbi:MAG TPA: hypothetical protein VG842_01385 [Sediminibacterium sp.]|nr:hypothetical protein [Sediminibacterium sp.]